MEFLFKRPVIAIYFALLVAGLVLLLTGYSFSLPMLNWILAGIIILYPVTAFYASALDRRVKWIISIVCAVILVVSLWNFPLIIAFSDKKRLVRQWNARSYELNLYKVQGWAGPEHFRYELVRNRLGGLLQKTVGYHTPGMNDNPECIISIVDDYPGSTVTGFFDKCSLSFTRKTIVDK